MENPKPSRLEFRSLMSDTRTILKTPAEKSLEVSRAIKEGTNTGAYMISEVHIDALGNAARLPIRGKKRRLLSTDYDPAKAGLVIVCLYNGQLSVIDGFLRIASAKASGYSYILCGILHGLDTKEMAKLRLDMNSATSLPAKTRFQLAAIAGYETELFIENMLRWADMSVYDASDTDYPHNYIPVTATNEFITLMKDPGAGKDCLSHIIDFLTDTGWKSLPGGTSPAVIKALYLAYISTKANKLLEKGWPALIKTMRSEMPKHLSFEARTAQLKRPEKTVAECMAAIFIKIILNVHYGKNAFCNETESQTGSS